MQTMPQPKKHCIDWPRLSPCIKYTILNWFPLDVLAKLTLTNKKEKIFIESFFISEWHIAEKERMELFMDAAKTGNTALFKLLMTNQGTVEFPDAQVLMAACHSGSHGIANQFLGNEHRAEIPSMDLNQLRYECFEEAFKAKDIDFIKWTGTSFGMTHDVLCHCIRVLEYQGLYDASKYIRCVSESLDALRTAAYTGNVKLMHEILSGPILRPGPFLSESYSPWDRYYDPSILGCATRQGQVDAVKYLLALKDRGIRMNFAFNDNWSFLLALQSGNLEIVQLLAKYPEVDTLQFPDVSLVSAVQSCNLQVVEWVIAESHRLNKQFSGYYRGSSVTIYAQTVPILRALMDELREDYDIKVFANAVEKGYSEIVVLYLDNPGNWGFDCQALERAIKTAATNDHSQILGKILKKAKENSWNVDLMPAMKAASEAGNASSMATLISFDTSKTMVLGGAILQNAIASGSIDAVRVLVTQNEPQVDPSAFRNKGIIDAASKGNLDLVKYLVSLQSKYPNIDPSDQGNKAFVEAIRNDHVRVAQYLVSLKDRFPGINPADQDNLALRIAFKHQMDHLVAFLLSLPREMGIDHSIVTCEITI